VRLASYHFFSVEIRNDYSVLVAIADVFNHSLAACCLFLVQVKVDRFDVDFGF
jgi:hypothetical protein